MRIRYPYRLPCSNSELGGCGARGAGGVLGGADTLHTRFLIEIRSIYSKYEEFIYFQKICLFSPLPFVFSHFDHDPN